MIAPHFKAMNLVSILGIGLLTISAGQAPSSGIASLPMCAPGRYVDRFQCGGLTRSYIMRVPPNYNGQKRLPLVLVLHGLTGTATNAETYTRMGELSESKGFVMVAPDGLGNDGMHGWNAGFFNLTGTKVDDVAFLDQLITRVEKQIGIDTDRVYVVGHSNGAFMTHLLAARLSSKIAAIGAVSGTIGVPGAGEGNRIPPPLAPVSVMIIHGKRDPMVQYDSGSTALLHGYSAAASAKYWAKADGCNLTPSVVETQGGNVVTETYSGGSHGTEVVLVSIGNGVHDWPGGVTKYGVESKTGVDAATLLWHFLETHPKKS